MCARGLGPPSTRVLNVVANGMRRKQKRKLPSKARM
jgi:hypothetical protein